MPTLNEVALETKSIIKWGAVALVALLLFFFLFKGGTIIKNILYPAKPTPPSVGFGKLNPIQFPTKSQKTYNYSLDTLTGTFPDFSDKIKVFQMIEPEADLLALKKTQEKLTRIGFYSTPTKISKDVYKWSDASPISKQITFNLFTSNFTLESNYLNDPNVTKAVNLPDVESAKNVAQSFFSNIDSMPIDIDSSKTKSVLLAITDSGLSPATSFSSSQVIKLYFFQSDVDKKPIFYSNPNESPINVSIAGGQYGSQIIMANFNHQNISESFETYPLKTAEEAFNELKEGGGYIALYEGNSDNISIKNINLGYYIGENKEDFLMPIIVFEGDNNFTAYVSAIKGEWLSN